MKRYWILLGLTVIIIAALMLPACSGEETTTSAPTTSAPTTSAPTTSKPTTSAPTTSAPTTSKPTTSAPTTSAPTTSAPTTAPVKATTLKLSYTMPKGASVARGFEWFGPEFEKRTQGRYKVEIYPGSTLVSIRAALDALRSGMCEIVMTSLGSFPKDFPLSGVASLPGLGFSPKTVPEYALTYEAGWEFINTNPEVLAEFKDFKLLFPFVLDPYNLISKRRPIHEAADFRGLKVGGSGGKMDIVSKNGGAAVQQVPPQTYDNLQKGVIDAAFVTFAQVGDYHLYDLCDYYYTADFGGGFIIMLMNLDAWGKLSAADQKIMMDTWVDASKESAQGSLTNIAAGKANTIAAGKTITEPTKGELDAWARSTGPAYESWKKDAMALGIDSATYDKILASWVSIQKKYAAQIK